MRLEMYSNLLAHANAKPASSLVYLRGKQISPERFVALSEISGRPMISLTVFVVALEYVAGLVYFLRVLVLKLRNPYR